MALAAETVTRPARRWWLIGLLTVLGALAGLGYDVVSHPVYTSNAYVVVVAQNPSDSLAVSYAQAYARIADQGAALNAAADASNRTASVSELRRQVQASASPDAPVIEITGSASSARRAADLANLVADGLVSTANMHSADTRMRLTVLSTAVPPADPTSPRRGLSVAVGTAVGLLLGGLALLGTAGRSGADRDREHVVRHERLSTGDGTAAADGQWLTARVPPSAPTAPAPGDQAEEPRLEHHNGRGIDGGRPGDGDSGATQDADERDRVDGGVAHGDTPR